MEAFFIPAAGGQRFCVYHAARGAVTRGSVLYIHPFAEEMNKSRRMAALQASALADAGYAVLQIDLLGCGDSSGDFADASWATWLDDVALACDWLRRRSPAPLWLWGLRSGCLVAAEAVRRMDTPCSLLFWQPSANGSLVLRQFLRLKLVGEMLGGKPSGVVDGLRKQLAEGRNVEVAGYELAPALASELERATLARSGNAVRLEWLDVTSGDATAVPALVAATQVGWEQVGCKVRYIAVEGPAFWQTTEIEEAPNLIRATVTALLEPAAA